MNHGRRFFATCVLLLFVPFLPAADSVIALIGVHVVPAWRPGVDRNQTVIVRGDRIVEVGPASQVKIPEGALRIEEKGAYLMPGLAEMHGHIPPPSAPRGFIENVLFLYVANGVTTVRGMLGAPGQLALRAAARRGEIISPTLYLAGPSFNGRSIDSPQQAIERVREQKAAGWDLLKIHPGLTREEYDAMARTAQEVGIDFAGHIPSDVGLLHALEMKQRTIDHLDGFIEYLGGFEGPVETAKMEQIARRTREAGTWVVPTMALWETLLGVPDLETLSGYSELKYMPPRAVENWRRAYRNRRNSPRFNRQQGLQAAANRKRLLKILHDQGVRILLGTDAPQQFSVPGFSIYREVRMMAECGLSPYDIVRAGTRNVGDYFQDHDHFGSVEPGQRADLILLRANPLEDVSNIRLQAGVMVRGRWLPESEIRARLEQIEQSYR